MSQFDLADEVYDEFAGTPHGKRLSKAARYGRFRPKEYSLKYWERLLRHDMNNLHHMRRTVAVARWFVGHENKLDETTFSRREASLLYVTAALHDQGEAIVGDAPHGTKTKQMLDNEIAALHDYESVFAPRLRGPGRVLYRIGRDKIAFGDTSDKLSAAFRAIELIGFIQNALAALQRIDQLMAASVSDKRAAYLGLKDKNTLDIVTVQLRRLSAEVLGSGVVEQLIGLSDRFPSLESFLAKHKEQISAGYNIDMSILEWYEPSEKKKRLQSFNTQKNVWGKWANSRS